MYILTLIADVPRSLLNEVILNKVFKTIEKKGGYIDNLQWLAPDTACDVHFHLREIGHNKHTDTDILYAVKEVIQPERIDVVVQLGAHRRKRVLIADMDSTMIKQECIDEIADFMGLKAKVSAITERAMNGEIDFKDALRERVSLLKGLSVATLNTVYQERIQLMDGASTLIGTMRKHGGFCILVSGGFTFFTSRVAEVLGFDVNEANVLEVDEHDKLSGIVREPILDKMAKLHCLESYASKLGVGAMEFIAVGDGANDIPMLHGAGTGVAYHAKPKVQESVAITINYTDLSSLLYIQGYSINEFYSS